MYIVKILKKLSSLKIGVMSTCCHVIVLKFEQCGFTIEQCIQKMQTEVFANSVDLDLICIYTVCSDLEHIGFFYCRPCDRTGEDLDIIYSRLKDIKVFEKFHPLLLQQICYYGYYEDLEKGVTRK